MMIVGQILLLTAENKIKEYTENDDYFTFY